MYAKTNSKPHTNERRCRRQELWLFFFLLLLSSSLRSLFDSFVAYITWCGCVDGSANWHQHTHTNGDRSAQHMHNCTHSLAVYVKCYSSFGMVPATRMFQVGGTSYNSTCITRTDQCIWHSFIPIYALCNIVWCAPPMMQQPNETIRQHSVFLLLLLCEQMRRAMGCRHRYVSGYELPRSEFIHTYRRCITMYTCTRIRWIECGGNAQRERTHTHTHTHSQRPHTASSLHTIIIIIIVYGTRGGRDAEKNMLFMAPDCANSSRHLPFHYENILSFSVSHTLAGSLSLASSCLVRFQDEWCSLNLCLSLPIFQINLIWTFGIWFLSSFRYHQLCCTTFSATRSHTHARSSSFQRDQRTIASFCCRWDTVRSFGRWFLISSKMERNGIVHCEMYVRVCVCVCMTRRMLAMTISSAHKSPDWDTRDRAKRPVRTHERTISQQETIG